MSKTMYTHYRKKNGTISCGALYDFHTGNKDMVTCPICIRNIKEREQ